MANEARTDVKLRYKSEGYARLRDEQGKLNDDLKETARSTKQGFEEAGRSIGNFERTIAKSLDSLEAYGRVPQALKSVGTEFDHLTKKVEALEKALKRTDERRGRFMQGFVQGAGVGEYIPAGPGMMRQVAGRFAGRAAAGPFRAASGGLFSGISGFAAGLASIPGGGLIAAPLQNAIGMAGEALQFQAAQLHALPMLGGAGLARNMARARQDPRSLQAAFAAGKSAFDAPVAPGDVQSRMRESMFHETTIDRLVEMGKNTLESNPAVIARRAIDKARYQQQVTKEAGGDEKVRARIEADIKLDRGIEAYQHELRRDREARAGKVRESFFSPIRQAGLRYGAMDATQANEFAQQLAQAGGTLDPRQMMATAVSAQTALGVGANVSGAFLRAQRRGGVAGGGTADATMTATIGEAMRIGLEGSELVQFMEEMASGIQQFEQTGIPINPRSVGAIARTVSVLGVGAARGARIAQGLVGAGQRLAQTGPESALDVMMLQQAGFGGGGGLGGLMDAMLALEQGLTGPQATAMMQGLVRAGGGGAGGVFTLQRGLQRLGVNVGLGEAKTIAGELEGGQPGASERIRAIMAEQAEGAKVAQAATPGGIQKLAETIVNDFGPAVKRQAGLTNQQLDVGRGLITSVQNLNSATTNMAQHFEKNLGPLLTLATGGIQELSVKIGELVDLIRKNGLPGIPGISLR